MNIPELEQFKKWIFKQGEIAEKREKSCLLTALNNLEKQYNQIDKSMNQTIDDVFEMNPRIPPKAENIRERMWILTDHLMRTEALLQELSQGRYEKYRGIDPDDLKNILLQKRHKDEIHLLKWERVLLQIKDPFAVEKQAAMNKINDLVNVHYGSYKNKAFEDRTGRMNRMNQLSEIIKQINEARSKFSIDTRTAAQTPDRVLFIIWLEQMTEEAKKSQKALMDEIFLDRGLSVISKEFDELIEDYKKPNLNEEQEKVQFQKISLKIQQFDEILGEIWECPDKEIIKNWFNGRKIDLRCARLENAIARHFPDSPSEILDDESVKPYVDQLQDDIRKHPDEVEKLQFQKRLSNLSKSPS